MSSDARQHSAANRLDLATIRETITYIRDDLAGVEGLEAASAALSMALVNIEQRERAASPRPTTFTRARFFPLKPR